MQRVTRSWALMKQSWRVLMQDKELMILPLLSGALILLVIASFAVPVFANGTEWVDGQPEWVWYVTGFVFYVVTYTITFFFQAAVVAGASERMAGGDPTLRSALGAAWGRFPALLMWGLVAGTVGMLIRSVEERSALAGKIAMMLVGAAWSLATYFMVPVLVMEREPLGSSFKRSWALFKQTWGETVVGSGGLALAGFLVSLPIMALAALLFSAQMVVAGVVLGVLGMATISVVFSALQGVFIAAVYRFATSHEVPAGFDESALQGSFRAR